MTAPKLRFVEVEGRRVAWRAAGAGPAAVLLHGAPQSSRAVAELGRCVAAAGLCAVMPDTPGAGHSTPLPVADMRIEDLAEALAGFADAIGLRRFALYGNHTGAAIAHAFTQRFPQRVTTLVLDGLAAWNDAERAAFEQHYAPPFLPVWDGAHMAWLWSRMEAQSVFFPWHRQNAESWRDVDLSPPWHLHRNAMDMLDAGDAYRAIYQASLAFDPAGMSVACPVRMMMLATDVLRDHAGRPALSHLPLTVFDVPEMFRRAVADALATHPGDELHVVLAPGLFRRGALAGTGKPLVLLHQAGASSRVFETLLPALAQPGPVIAFDLPGHGFDETALPDSATEIAALVAAECNALGFDDVNVAGRRFGGVIAQAIAQVSSHAGVRAADLQARAGAPDLAGKGAVDLAPAWDGGHLLRAWRVAWRQAIWDPWYRNDAAAALAPRTDLDPAAIHAAAVDLLRAGPAWRTANQIEAAAGAAQTILPDRADRWPAILAAWR